MSPSAILRTPTLTEFNFGLPCLNSMQAPVGRTPAVLSALWALQQTSGLFHNHSEGLGGAACRTKYQVRFFLQPPTLSSLYRIVHAASNTAAVVSQFRTNDFEMSGNNSALNFINHTARKIK